MFESFVIIPVSTVLGAVGGGGGYLWFTLHKSKGGGEHDENIEGILGVKDGQSMDDIKDFLSSIPDGAKFHSFVGFAATGATMALAASIGAMSFATGMAPEQLFASTVENMVPKTFTI